MASLTRYCIQRDNELKPQDSLSFCNYNFVVNDDVVRDDDDDDDDDDTDKHHDNNDGNYLCCNVSLCTYSFFI